jgi:uncharacterized Rmd1/YagE family protein
MIKGSKQSEEAKIKMSLAHKGKQTWNKGKKMSAEFIETNRRVHIGKKASVETRAKMSLVHMGNKSNTGRTASEETKRKMSKSHKGKLSSERVAILKRVWDNPEYHKKQSASHKGLQNSLGFKHDDSFREKVRKRMTGREVKEETRRKLSESLKGKPKSIETIEKFKAIRNNPDRLSDWNRNVLRASHARPNTVESSLLELLNSLYPNQYKYTGNGEVIIGGINPDFININGQKKVIELYGDYWHQGDNPQDRVDRFAVYGFGCLVIWQSELKHMNKVIAKLKRFHERNLTKGISL